MQHKMDGISNKIREKIESEISDAIFVAFSLDEMTNVTNKKK